MSRHKGQLSATAIDREWPHQVALLDDLCVMGNLTLIMKYCADHRLTYKTRRVTAIWPNGKQERFRLYCFGERASAEAFQSYFGGVLFDPKRDREGGRARGAWHRKDQWTRVLESGPLSVPEILRD